MGLADDLVGSASIASRGGNKNKARPKTVLTANSVNHIYLSAALGFIQCQSMHMKTSASNQRKKQTATAVSTVLDQC